MPMISPDEKLNLYQALTRYNYFPNQKGSITEDKRDGELPPCIDTRQFTPDICELISSDCGIGSNEGKEGRKGGYDVVEYKATRFNNMPRTLSLIHPKAYSLLAKCIHDNWDHLKHIQDSEHSHVTPKQSHDGRIMVMNYGDQPLEQTHRYINASFGMKFKVTADIANCFNSIYTHAIPWALVGFDQAKSDYRNGWHNSLDKYQRNCKRNETQGIPIGPASSSIVAEIILQKVDEALCKNFKFERYVDDYTCFCPSYEAAQEFILRLGQELAVYKLTLNLHKTSITKLPCSNQDDWILKLLAALPNKYAKPEGAEEKLNAAETITFINHAIKLNELSPDGSVLKYALRLVVNDLDYIAALSVLDLVINLAWHYPTLIPFISTVLDNLKQHEHLSFNSQFNQLNLIIIENARQLRSDGMSWPLYILKHYNQQPSEETVQAVLDSRDCVSITILYSFLEQKEKIIEFAQTILEKNDDFTKDNYWLLLYQLFLNNDLTEGYCSDRVFSILKEHSVNFIPGDTVTEAERKFEEKNNPFSSIHVDVEAFIDSLYSENSTKS